MIEDTKLNYDWTQEDLDASVARARASTKDGVWQVYAHIPHLGYFGRHDRAFGGTLQEAVDFALTVGIQNLRYSKTMAFRIGESDRLIFQVIVQGPPRIVDGEPAGYQGYVIQSRMVELIIVEPDKVWRLRDGDNVMTFDLDAIRDQVAELARQAVDMEGVREDVLDATRETKSKTVEIGEFVVTLYEDFYNADVRGPNWKMGVPRARYLGPDDSFLKRARAM